MHVTSEGKEASALEQITNLLFSSFLSGCTHLTAFSSLASPSIEAVDHWLSLCAYGLSPGSHGRQRGGKMFVQRETASS